MSSKQRAGQWGRCAALCRLPQPDGEVEAPWWAAFVHGRLAFCIGPTGACPPPARACPTCAVLRTARPGEGVSRTDDQTTTTCSRAPGGSCSRFTRPPAAMAGGGQGERQQREAASSQASRATPGAVSDDMHSTHDWMLCNPRGKPSLPCPPGPMCRQGSGLASTPGSRPGSVLTCGGLNLPHSVAAAADDERGVHNVDHQAIYGVARHSYSAQGGTASQRRRSCMVELLPLQRPGNAACIAAHSLVV